MKRKSWRLGLSEARFRVLSSSHTDHSSKCWLNTGGSLCTCTTALTHQFSCNVMVGGACNCNLNVMPSLIPASASWHAGGCSIWQPKGSCDCGVNPKPQKRLAELDPWDLTTGCSHIAAKDPLWHEGKYWNYCKYCGDWISEWTGKKRP